MICRDCRAVADEVARLAAVNAEAILDVLFAFFLGETTMADRVDLHLHVL